MKQEIFMEIFLEYIWRNFGKTMKKFLNLENFQILEKCKYSRNFDLFLGNIVGKYHNNLKF